MFIILFFLSIKHAALVANLMYHVEYNFFKNNHHLTGHPPIHLTGSCVTIEHWTSSATVGSKSSGLVGIFNFFWFVPLEIWPPFLLQVCPKLCYFIHKYACLGFGQPLFTSFEIIPIIYRYICITEKIQFVQFIQTK